MATMEELYATLRRFKSLKQHRDLVQAQYEHLRSELAKRFDDLGITSIEDGDTVVSRTHYRQYEYEIPLLKKHLDEKTFNYVTENKLVVVGRNFTEAAITGAIKHDLARKTKILLVETDVIRIVEVRKNH